MLDFLDKVDEVQHSLNKQGLVYKMADICRLAASMPAPRFYTDVNTALIQYYRYKNKQSCIRQVAKRRMYAEIFARYESALDSLRATGQHIHKAKVMESILQQPAPSFYYDDKSALKMYYYIMANKKRLRRR